ncbi:MAG TPA: decarboxylating 6-phosphogluconate dehydrogenase, partial [bacterium]
GRMGMQIARRVAAAGVPVVGFDPAPHAAASLRQGGIEAVASLADLAASLAAPRVIWVMVPAGDATEAVVGGLTSHLAPGDVLVDGGNSHFKDSMRRAAAASGRGIGFLDCGTSGGIYGEREGFCLMVGGNPQPVSTVERIFRILAQEGGYLHVGPSGSGHYTKMIHNAVEYALMEAYGEGFELLAARRDFNIDAGKVARLWGKGSVVRSWLLELAADALERDPGLGGIKGYVADTGEGRWAALEAIEQGVPVPGIQTALMQRQRSRQDDSFSAKLVAALRHEFGGHEVVHEK